MSSSASVARRIACERITLLCVCSLALLVVSPATFAQNGVGELVVMTRDPQNLPIQCAIEVSSAATQVHEKSLTDVRGIYYRRSLPLGTYTVRVSHPGFLISSRTVQISSGVPVSIAIRLLIQPDKANVSVNEEQPLVDPHQTGTANEVGPAGLETLPLSHPGRSLIDVVAAQPGWVLESNGTLHARGSENQVQYVVNGIPLTDNRSPAFGAGNDFEDVEAVSVLTGQIPAEYGRKLGGVVEVYTNANTATGLHGHLSASAGSFATTAEDAGGTYGTRRSAVAIAVHHDMTDRYLDPPVLQNLTNSGHNSGEALTYQRDLKASDRLDLSVEHEAVLFEVPNELVQQQAGQLQHRSNYETRGTTGYEHVFSSNAVADFHLMARDVSASLASNALAIPIIAAQQRGWREWYANGAFSLNHGIHHLKAGLELDHSSIHEQFSYRITNFSSFDPGTQPDLHFAGLGTDREAALFVEDAVYSGKWSINAGLRYDHYSLLVRDSAVSPRLAIAYYWPREHLNVHASYDRVFQTPASENILLSSAAVVQQLSSEVLRLPVHPSTGNYWDAGIGKSLVGVMKLDVDYYRRGLRNYADDDVLLNTGVSFPISFASGHIYGLDAKLSLVRWKRLAGFVSYSYMVGFADTPVTGGLFLGDAAAGALSAGRFPITQDQRNTVMGRVIVQFTKRWWTGFGTSYGSGLPTEFSGDRQDALQQYGREIADRVDFCRGRVKPSLALDASFAADIIKRDALTLRLQVDGYDLNNRLNLINFAGLFSGTGIAPPRSFAVQLRTTF